MLFPAAEKRQTDNMFSGLSVSPSSLERGALCYRYAEKLSINPDFTRALVSFQANKNAPFYRWLKYKEAFSSKLVSYFLDLYRAKGAPDGD